MSGMNIVLPRDFLRWVYEKLMNYANFENCKYFFMLYSHNELLKKSSNRFENHAITPIFIHRTNSSIYTLSYPKSHNLLSNNLSERRVDLENTDNFH